MSERPRSLTHIFTQAAAGSLSLARSERSGRSAAHSVLMELERTQATDAGRANIRSVNEFERQKALFTKDIKVIDLIKSVEACQYR